MKLRSFDEAYVVSDLHLGGGPGFQMFASTDRFEELIQYMVRRLRKLRRTKKAAGNGEAEVLLVINGDFVDFLAEREFFLTTGPQHYFLANRGEEALRKILLEKDRFAGVTEALRDFVKSPGAHLAIILGNHDLELSLDGCQETFLNIVTDGDRRRRSNVELCFNGWGYRFQVAGKRALCLHGNETDMFNFTRYDELDRIQREIAIHGSSEFGEKWIPSAGTQFVVNAVNRLKEKFPFVDLMHPLLPLVPTVLGAIDPRNIRYAQEAAEMGARAVAYEKTRPASQRHMLSLDANEPRQFRGEQTTRVISIAETVEAAFAEGRIDELMQPDRSMDRETLGWTDWVDSIRNAVDEFCEFSSDLAAAGVRALSEEARKSHREMVRRLLDKVVADQLDSPNELSKDDIAMEQTIRGDYDVIFAGHTHHRRLARRSKRIGVHVNTGSWADRMTLLSRDVRDARRFDKIYRALTAADRDELTSGKLGLVRRECPVAVMGDLTDFGSPGINVALGDVEAGQTAEFQVEFNEPLN